MLVVLIEHMGALYLNNGAKFEKSNFNILLYQLNVSIRLTVAKPESECGSHKIGSHLWVSGCVRLGGDIDYVSVTRCWRGLPEPSSSQATSLVIKV